MFSKSPCGLADSEIRTPIAPDYKIRRSISAGGVTTPKSECDEMLVKTDKLFRFG